MSTETIGIIMNGVTGRMGTNQHLVRSILENSIAYTVRGVAYVQQKYPDDFTQWWV